MQNKRIFMLFFFLFFTCIIPLKASAMPVVDTIAEKNTGATAKSAAKTSTSSNLTAKSTESETDLTLGEKILKAITDQTVTASKIVALIAEQELVKSIIGEGNNGTFIKNFNDYLFVSPQQKAMSQTNLFFNSVSRGRLSSLNYEGVGPNYDSYLVAQANRIISGQLFVTDIQSQTTDPKKMFADGNMKGIMSFMKCANNPYCYTIVAAQKYNTEFSKAQEIAKNENVNGFTPKKANGRITQPATLAQNALSQIDQLGTQIIMNASPEQGTSAALYQIAEGTAISTAARLAAYGISDDAGREAIRNNNSQFPFSLEYNSNGGLGINAGGVTVNTGFGAYNGNVQIGNTQACLDAGVYGNGEAWVYINGTRQKCPGKTGTTYQAPEAAITIPSITCATNEACVTACGILPGCNNLKCVNGKCVR